MPSFDDNQISISLFYSEIKIMLAKIYRPVYSKMQGLKFDVICTHLADNILALFLGRTTLHHSTLKRADF